MKKVMYIELVQHEDYLEVIVTGRYDHQDAIYRFPLVIDTCRLIGIDKALIDFRELQGDIAATLKVLYTLKIKEYYDNHIKAGGMPLKIAYVGSPPQVISYEPGNNLAQNVHLPTKLTTDKNEALLWLGVK